MEGSMMEKTKKAKTPGKLTVVKRDEMDPRQYSIMGDHENLDGEWTDIYFEMSGFVGSYNPNMIAAAPVMYNALKDIERAALGGYLTPELVAHITLGALEVADKE